MKKRRTLIIALLLVAALALGIGYAGFTSQLSVDGEAILNGVSTSEVVITKIEIVEKTEGANYITCESNCGENGTKSATVDVAGFKEVNEYAIIEVTVSNPHPFEVTTTAPALVVDSATNTIPGENAGNYFDITLHGEPLASTIAADGTETFQVKIVAKVITPDAHTTNFDIDFNASTRG